VPDGQTSDCSPARWSALGAVAPDALIDNRLTLHHAAQLLASFGQAMLAAREDDSHRGATWEEGRQGFVSDETPDGLVMSLVVPSFAIEVWRNDDRVGSLDLRGRRPSEGLAWLGDLLVEARESGAGPLAWPEYELPEQPGGSDSPLSPDPSSLEELAAWYDDGAQILERVLGDLPEASSIRCWPHHFDLGALLTFPPSGGYDDAAYVGVGLSPGDDAIPHPYYYVNGSPSPSLESLPPLDGPGEWHTEGWVGAVLRAEEIVSSGSAAAQEQTVGNFLTSAVDAMRTTVLAAR
jgi:hypothetical protein